MSKTRSHTKYMILIWLEKKGRGSPSEFWKEKAPHLKYETIVKYFMQLRNEGVIRVCGEEVNSKFSPIKKKYYCIVEGKMPF